MAECERLYHNLRVISGQIKRATEDLESLETQRSEILDRLDVIERNADPTSEKS